MEDLNMLSEEIELVDIDLDIDGNVKPPKNDKIALIDADTIAFTACLNVEEECEVLPQEFYSDEEWDELKPKIKDGVYYNVDELAAIAKAKEKIDRILDKTGCKDVELHFTGGHKNFRYSIYPEYKANRKNMRAPAKLREVKEALCKMYKGTIHTKWEADDVYVFKLQRDFAIRNAEREELKNLASTRILGNTKKSSGHHTAKCGKSKIYSQWDNMLDRCYGVYKDSIAHYKDNNIKVYQPWVEDPNNYIDWAEANGWFEGCSIDRIDYFGHYIPSNIQFITKGLNTIKQNLIDNPKTFIDFESLLRIRKQRKAGDTWQAILNEGYTENLRSSLTKQLKNIEGFTKQLDYLVSRLSENVKFKLNDRYYECKGGKAESYRDYIGAAVDKDCLNSVSTNDICKQFNYYESGLYNIEMKWMEIDKYTSITWKYLQTLIGDKIDNIIGLKGIGPAKAQKILKGLMTNKELWLAVEEAYKIKGRTAEDAVLNLNLVDMNLLQADGTIKLHTLEELRND